MLFLLLSHSNFHSQAQSLSLLYGRHLLGILLPAFFIFFKCLLFIYNDRGNAEGIL